MRDKTMSHVKNVIASLCPGRVGNEGLAGYIRRTLCVEARPLACSAAKIREHFELTRNRAVVPSNDSFCGLETQRTLRVIENTTFI